MEHNIFLFCLRPYALLIKSTLSFASSLSWSLQRAATLMEDLSARRATRSCPLRWREQGASGTHAHLPSSKKADYCLSYMHNYTHTTRACKQTCLSTPPCAMGDFFISRRAICANQSAESSSERFAISSSHRRCRWSLRLCVNYGMKYVLKLECGNMHGV